MTATVNPQHTADADLGREIRTKRSEAAAKTFSGE
jgi:hypothetical protein